MKDESPVCSTGCVEYRLGCLRDSRNYAECVPLEECERRALVGIILGSIIGAIFCGVCTVVIAQAICGKKSSDTVDDSAY